MENKIGVYQIELNGKRYVGSTAIRFRERWWSHLNQLRKGTHPNRHLLNAFNKYGEDALKFSILEIVETPEEIIVIEQRYIDELKPEYNMCKIAGNCYGRKFTEESKRKMSEIKKGKNNNRLGLKHTEEAKKKISKGRKGMKFSEEHKQNLRKTAKLRTVSDETRVKMRKSIKKWWDIEENKLKMSKAHMGNKYGLGYKHSEETKKKMSEAKKGFVMSEEQKLKLSESVKQFWIKKKKERFSNVK